MLAGMLALCLGIGSIGSISALYGSEIYFVTALLLLVWWRFKRLWIGLIALFLLGHCWGNWHAVERRDGLLDAALNRQTVTVIGEVRGLPSVREANGRRYSRIDLYPDQVRTESDELVPLNGPIRLSVFGEDPLQPCTRGVWQVRLKRPHGLANPAAFNYGDWLVAAGYSATGYSAAAWRALDQQPSWRCKIDRWRFQFQQQLNRMMGAHPQSGLLPALLVGSREGVSSAQWQLFNETGTIHLMVISGLHIGMLALLVTLAMVPIVKLSALVRHGRPLRGMLPIAVIAVAAGYALLAGFSLPTQRALIMLATGLLVIWLGRQVAPLFALLLALLVVLIVDPLAPLGRGFWLSFGAVALLLVSSMGIWGAPQRWRWVVVQTILLIGLSPLLASFGGVVSPISLLANLVAVPLLGFLVLPLLLLGLIGWIFSVAVAEWPFWLALQVLQWLMDYLQWLRTLPLADYRLAPLQSSGVLLLAVASVSCWLLPRGFPMRHLALLGLLPLLLPWREPIPEGEVSVTLLDVGQGQSILIETARHRLLYDVGPDFGDTFNSVDVAIAPALAIRGVESLDHLILSHNDLDHAAAAARLLKRIEVGRVSFGEPITGVTRGDRCQRGQQWRWDEVNFSILHPAEQCEEGNDCSCVLRVDADNLSALIVGDISRDVEQALLDSGQLSQADLLVVGHHGSHSSSSWPFLRAVSPRWAAVSAGYANGFGHPAGEVLERLQILGVATHITARDGALNYRAKQGADCYRAHVLRFWDSQSVCAVNPPSYNRSIMAADKGLSDHP